MKVRKTAFTVDGVRLRGKLYIPQNNPRRLALLFIHGFTGKPGDDAAAVLAKNGFWSMTFSLKGHNDSEGDIKKISRADSLRDTVVAYDFFKLFLPTGTGIGVVGNSYGGYLAPLLSTERDIACVSMRVPANYRDEAFEQPQFGHGSEDPVVAKWRQEKLGSSATRALRALNVFKGPIQIVEAELDDAIPHQTVQNYLDAVQDKSQLEYHFMQGWPHSMGDDKKRNKQFQELLLSWVSKQEKRL